MGPARHIKLFSSPAVTLSTSFQRLTLNLSFVISIQQEKKGRNYLSFCIHQLANKSFLCIMEESEIIICTIYLLSVALNTNVALKNPHLETFSKHLQCFLGLELLSTVIFNKRRIMNQLIYSLFTPLQSPPNVLYICIQ